MKGTTIVYGMCGSFCSFEKSLAALAKIKSEGARILPAMSYNAAAMDTKFGKAEDFRSRLAALGDAPIIDTIQAAEPIGPQKLCDVLVVAPCTGNTLAKLALGITDTPITMACKSHLRIGRPVVLAVCTNDALGASGQNIGRLMNTKNIYFVPMYQDDPIRKPTSLVADFDQLSDTIELARRGKQAEPVFF